MSDRRFEERIAELEAEAAESEANAAKWAQESIDFEDRLWRAETSVATLEAENAKLARALKVAMGALQEALRQAEMYNEDTEFFLDSLTEVEAELR